MCLRINLLHIFLIVFHKDYHHLTDLETGFK